MTTKNSGMLAPERHSQILALVQAEGSVRVARLARQLNVTEETIRRDLERLGAAGQLVRTHGGAVQRPGDRSELPFGVRETVQLAEKRAIARRAAEFIVEGEVIALDASSSAYELARVLPEFPLTVITNSLAVATALADRKHVRIICTGGILDAPSLSFVGSLAEQALDRFHIRKLFLSCQGVDAQRGLSVQTDEHGRIKRRMIDLALTTYLLVDGSKFGVSAVEFFAPVTKADIIVTDSSAPGAALQRLMELGIRVEVA